MAASGATVRALPGKRRAKETRPAKVHTAPEVVINRVEVTITLAPQMFGVPLHLVDWILERLGLVTKEQLAAVIDPSFDDETPVEPVPTDRSQLKVGRPEAARKQRKAA